MRKRFYRENGGLNIYALIILALVINVQCHTGKNQDITVYSSSADGDRMTKRTGGSFSVDKDSLLQAIIVDEGIRYQKIDGFGATFNEAGMICLNSLVPAAQDSVLRLLFDPEAGAGYTLMKSPVAACDFASAGPWYSYNDTPGDTSMIHFSVERDLRPDGLIPFIRKAKDHGSFKIQSPMDFAPDWMYFGLKHGEKHIKPQYYSALALYYSKYLRAYSDNGVKIDYLTLFNEPNNTNPNQGYSDVSYDEIGIMIKDFIIPRFQKDGLSPGFLLGETCFRYDGLLKFPVVLDNPDMRKYITRLGVHGYDLDSFSSLTGLHERYPDLPVWMTEICYVKMPVYEFSDGEYWGNMIVNDLKNWVSGWIYWNMILDQDGGPWLTSPEHSDPDNNHQHPVVIVDRNTKKVTCTGLYYYLAHFSKFVKPGDYRISCTGNIPQLNFVGFRNDAGTIVLNVINNGPETDCKILWKNTMTVQKLKASSITTIRWNGLRQ